MIRNVVANDGRQLTVDLADDRIVAFDSLAVNPTFRALLGATANDAQEALSFMVSQLTYTEAGIYARQRTPMQYESLVPITNEAGEWATSIRFETEDIVGQGKRISGKGKDIPLVDSAMGDVTYNVEMGAVGYDYTMEELRQTAFLRRPISERRLIAATEAYKRHLNQVALFGELNLPGLYNQSTVPSGNAVNGAWLTTNSGNPALIRQDINEMIRSVWNVTQYNELITDIGIEPNCYAFISETPFNAYSEKTILDYVKQSNIAKTEKQIDINFFPMYDTTGYGPGGTNMMMAYVKDNEHLVMHVPLPLRFLAPQLRGLAVEIPGEYKYCGVEFRRPKSAVYRYGI
jgi:hypothetical protein